MKLAKLLEGHRIKTIHKDSYDYHRAKCSCDWPGSPWGSRYLAQEEFYRHVAEEILSFQEGAR